MPTYEYMCQKCGHEFDYFQSMTSTPLDICPQCGGGLKRKIGAGLSPIFKGSGFYQTDYKPSKPEPSAPSGEGKKDATPPPPAGSSDPKPADKPKDKPDGTK